MASAVVLTINFGTLDGVIEAQAKVVNAFLPPDCDFVQWFSGDHSYGIDTFLRRDKHEVVVLLDIDCIPLNREILPQMIAKAREGILVGCVQRANHIENGQHLYAGPCGTAFSRELYDRIGRPSFAATERGDVGEELTYGCERLGIPVELLWPTHVVSPRWHLRDGKMFGNGTTYANALYHAFEIGIGLTRQMFLEKCREVLSGVNHEL